MMPHDFRLADLSSATALLTRLPIPADYTRGARAAWAWPLAGALVGAFTALPVMLVVALGVPSTVAAGLALTLSTLLTGAMHEDGLADSADGLWGGHNPARRLEIMKDSATGAYGVVALILGIGLRWSALSALIAAGWVVLPLLLAGVLSRAPMVVLAGRLPNARDTGASALTGRPSGQSQVVASALALLAGVILAGWAGLVAVIAAALVTLGFGRVAIRLIGGQTGDILGASQQLAEITVLIVLATALATAA